MVLQQKVLVTGGTGFIGSHLCRDLLLQGAYVICLDNNFTGSLDNVSDLRDNPNFEFIRHDITEPILLEVDRIYHLACPASPIHYQINGIKTIKTNIIGTLNMCGLSKRVGARLLLASTSEVYGDPEVTPQHEEYWGHVNPVGPRSCYDEGKRVAETLVMEYNKSENVDVRIARIFNTYGPGLNKEDGRVISNFIVQALKNEPITVYGDGMQTRSFCFVSDTVSALMKLMEETDYTNPVNIGNPTEVNVMDVARKILKKSGSESKIVFENLPVDDPMQRCPDIGRIQDLTGWEPLISFDEGIVKTIEYFSKVVKG